MSERSRLKRIAIVAGYAVTPGSSGYRDFLCRGGVEWNPENNDRDAFQLAMDIGFVIDPSLAQGSTSQERNAWMRKAIADHALELYDSKAESA